MLPLKPGAAEWSAQQHGDREPSAVQRMNSLSSDETVFTSWSSVPTPRSTPPTPNLEAPEIVDHSTPTAGNNVSFSSQIYGVLSRIELPYLNRKTGHANGRIGQSQNERPLYPLTSSHAERLSGSVPPAANFSLPAIGERIGVSSGSVLYARPSSSLSITSNRTVRASRKQPTEESVPDPTEGQVAERGISSSFLDPFTWNNRPVHAQVQRAQTSSSRATAAESSRARTSSWGERAGFSSQLNNVAECFGPSPTGPRIGQFSRLPDRQPASYYTWSSSQQANGAESSGRRLPSGPRIGPRFSPTYQQPASIHTCSISCVQQYGKNHHSGNIDSFECPLLRHDTKMIEARRNEQISRTILEIPVVYLETDWFQIRCSLVSRGVHPFSLAILDFLDAHVHPQPVELRTHNNYGDEMFKPFPDGTRRRHQDINADLGIARRLLELLDDAPAFFANAKSLSAADEVCFWMDAYRLFWHTILYVVTRIGAGDPRHVKLVCILNELYGICRCPPPSGILSNYNHKVYCDRECFERNVPCQSKIETLFYKKRYLWLWERLVESWNVYEFHAPLFPMVIERERNGNFTEARTWPNNHMFARHVSCIPGEDFAPYAPTNEASVWSVEEWVRLNSFLARFVRLRGTELPFAHVQGGSLYPVLCLKGFYAMIEAFEVSPSAMNLNASLAAIGAASQWILLGRFTQISLAVHAAHLEFSREACPQRYDIRVLRHPQGFGDRYPVNLSPDLISRWEFWVWRLTQIIVSCNDQTPHYVFDLARHARRRIDEDEVEDWTNCITYSGLPICDKLEEETKKKRKEKREERHRQRERQRRRGRQPGSVNAGLEAQADWTVRAHVIKTELTDWRLYNGTHPRKSFNLND